MLRPALLFLVLCAGCIPGRAELLRKLHDGLDEVDTAESAEMPYRAPTPDVGPLVGMSRREIGDALGSGDCDPQGAGGQRCLFHFSTDPDPLSGHPLVLELDFDAGDKCTVARWRELP